MRTVLLILLLATMAGAEGWPVRGGNPARNRVGEDLEESLPRRPLWRCQVRERDRTFSARYGEWSRTMLDRAPAPAPKGAVERARDLAYPANHPVVAGGLVLFRDGVEVVARRVGSGAFVGLRGRYLGALQPRPQEFPARFVRDGAYVDLARTLATLAEHKAWAALVEAQLTGDTSALRTTFKGVKVPYQDTILTGAEAARRLEAR